MHQVGEGGGDRFSGEMLLLYLNFKARGTESRLHQSSRNAATNQGERLGFFTIMYLLPAPCSHLPHVPIEFVAKPRTSGLTDSAFGTHSPRPTCTSLPPG